MKRIAIWTFRVLVLITLLSCSIAVRATDGVVEINQTRILASGGHFPYVISQAGSYRLTSNLDVTADSTNPAAAQNRTAISIAATDPVTIDLNGFTILGPTSCTGGPPVTACTPTGSGFGIVRPSGTSTSVTIRNGTIKGMGFAAIAVQASNLQIERVIALSNGGAGIAGGPGMVVDCEARTNNGVGIYATNVVDSVAYGNAGTGIQALGVAKGNSSSNNGGFGIEALGAGVVLLGNSVVANGAAGLSLTSNSGYAQNVVVGGTTVSGGVPLGSNLCNGSTTCP